MVIIKGKMTVLVQTLSMAIMLSGCGLTQRVTDETAAVAKAIFYRQVKTLHLDIRAREAVNSNTRGEPLSTVIRIYQLSERQTFDVADYPSLFADDSQILKDILLSQRDISLQPGGAIMVDMPMDDRVQYVAVAGMFISPDVRNDTWRVVIARDELDPDNARVIEVGNHCLTVKSVKDD